MEMKRKVDKEIPRPPSIKLRDYFAALAMQAIIGRRSLDTDMNIFCKILDEFYPENIYAGENFDEFVAVHAALRHAKATLLRANGGTEGAISH
jgi:hypothetical protein